MENQSKERTRKKTLILKTLVYHKPVFWEKMFLFPSQWLSRDPKRNLPFSPTGIVLPFWAIAGFRKRIDYESSAQSKKIIWNTNSYNGQFKISRNKLWQVSKLRVIKITNKNISKWLSYFSGTISRIVGGMWLTLVYIVWRTYGKH